MVNLKKEVLIPKIKRVLTGILPVDKNRRGECKRCGECCKLVFVCPFLRYDKEGKSFCKIYGIRPLACRKYPRVESTHATKDVCGFWFKK